MPARIPRRVAGHFRAHHEWYWAPLLYCVAFAVIYHEIFFPGEAPRQGFGWDTLESYWPDVAFLAGAFADGDWPLWNPWERGGEPFMAVPDRGLYYPVNWVLAAWGALVGEASWWLGQLKMFGHHIIAASMMHLYLRSRGLPRAAAIIGGLAWMASAPMLLHKASAVIWPLVWAPLLWLAADAVIERPNWRRGVLLGGALMMAGQTGTVGFFYALLLAVPYGAARLATAVWTRRGDRAELLRFGRRFGLALAVAAAVTLAFLAITVLPGLEHAARSHRAERTAQYALQFPMPPRQTLTGLWAPTTGTYDAYIGIGVMMLGLCGLIIRPLRDRGAPILFAAMALFFLALSFGAHTPVLPWLVEHVPGFDLFRISNRYRLLVAPALAALGGYGAAAVIAAPRAWSRPRITGLAVAIAVVALVAGLLRWFPLPANPPPMPAPWLSLLLATVAAAGVITALLLPGRWAFIAVLALAPLVVYEPQHYVHFRAKALEQRPDNLEDRRWLEGLADVRTEWRIFDEFVLEQRAGSRLGIREMRSYPAGGSLDSPRYQALMRYAGKRPGILGAFNIRYLFHGPHHRAGKRPNFIKQPPDRIDPQRFVRLRDHVFELLDPAPAVAWYGAATVVPDRGTAVLDAVHASLAAPGPPRHAVLEPDAAAQLEPALIEGLEAAMERVPEPVAGRIQTLEYDRVVTTIAAPGPGLVVLNETMYPGWRVWVDGQPVRPVLAGWLLRAVPVDAGSHVIEWRFQPRRYGLYALLWMLALLAVVAALAGPKVQSLVRKRRSRSRLPPQS